jgi:hypothetical protein
MFGAVHFAACIRASIRFAVTVFLGTLSRRKCKLGSRSAPPSFTGLFVVPVLLSLFSDDILKSVQPSPSRATTFAFEKMWKAGKLAGLS